MEITFLGQQGWLVSNNNAHIIIDPILTQDFGTSKELKFKVCPPRILEINNIPKLDAIFITNIHFDYFNIDSLKLLDKSIPIYIGQITPQCIKEAIKSLGFQLFEIPNNNDVNIKNLTISFFIAKNDSPLWNNRAYQLCITDAEENGVFFQSNCLVSDYFIEQIKSGIIRCPKVFVATNNTQMFISEGSGLFDNINPYTKTSDSNFLGIEFLCRMFSQYPNELNNISNILLTNGSYLIDDNDNDSNPSLFVDPESINNHLEKLSMAGLEGKYLLPGQKMKIEGNIIGYDKASWIRLDAEQYEKYKKKICINKKDELCLKAPLFSKYSNDNKIESMLPMIEDELQNIAKLMLLCKMGALLVRTNKYLDTPLTPERLILNFRCANKTVRQYALNINTASFDYLPSTAEDLFKKYPFGIDIYIEDFIALLNGEIQIKELALANIKQWYIGDKISSPIAFLLNYFSIQQRGDLVYKLQ